MNTGKCTSLYVTILSLSVVISVVIATSVAGYNYVKEEELAREMAEVQLSEMSDTVILETRRIFEPAISVVSLMDKIEGTAVKPRLHSHPAAQLMMDSLERYPQLLSIYMGFDDGDFYQAVSFQGENSNTREALQAPREAMFGLRTVRLLETYSPAASAVLPDRMVKKESGREPVSRSGQRPDDVMISSVPQASPVSGATQRWRRIEMWVWLNAQRKIVGARTERNATYDPRNRPWFALANANSGAVMTDYYTFAESQSLGVTVAHRFDGQIAGVIGVDMTVQSISLFLKQERASDNGLVFMFTEDGKLSAYPDPLRVVHVSAEAVPAITPVYLDSFDDPVAARVYALFRQDRSPRLREFTVDGKRWLVRFSLIPSPMSKKGYVAVAAPLTDFTSSMDRVRLESLAFALGVIICMIPVIMIISRRISRPLSALVAETEEIRNFRLDKEVAVHSRIGEVAELATAFVTMKHTLSTFGRYLPKTLVRQFVSSDIIPEIGGERRELSLLFSDVTGFTSLSERMDAESLMVKMSVYFQELGSPVLQHSGTIDKFIGDAMMAFWNAPVMQEDHVVRACAAALQCRHVLAALNARWVAEACVPLPTRFGLHTGECVVGNVGSFDRMNYTAMGAHVNIAARLEGLNKVYHTSILASGAIQEKGHGVFMFRSVDIACPKGTSDPVHLFELLCARPGHEQYGASLSKQDVVWLNRWEKAVLEYRTMQFSAALVAFSALQHERPDDFLAGMYVARCTQLVRTPPDMGWSPVVMHDNK